MEIKTVFSIIIGILMMATVILATVVIMGGLIQLSAEECSPAEYKASDEFTGRTCGFDSNDNRLYCISYDLNFDDCVDPGKNLCCPTATEPQDSWRIRIINGKCCNITSLNNNKQVCLNYRTDLTGKECTNAGCYWYPACSGHKVNQWKDDKCFDTVQNPAYACIESYCGAPDPCNPYGPSPCSVWDSAVCDCVKSLCS